MLQVKFIFYFNFFKLEFGVPYSRLEKLRKKNINKSTEIFPRNFKFREIHKESWVSPTNFIV